jgi:hypothetical protein
MGNRSAATICGVGQVILKLTSGKTLVLQDMLFVLTMTHILLNGSMLSHRGIKLVFDSNKVVFTKLGSFL